MARVAFLLADDFEDSEFRVPYDKVRAAGHEPVVIGVRAGIQVLGKKGQETIRTEGTAAEEHAADYDLLVIPGGYSPDHLRTDKGVVSLVREFSAAMKPIAAVCHGPSLLIEADLVRDRTLTSWPSIKQDLINAGARWVDERVVEDANLITSRNPQDLDAFSEAITQRLHS
jgi:protease I